MWKDIYGWEMLYEVNEYGDVRNKINHHIIKGDVNSSGYYRVTLYNKKHIPSKQRFFRHRLVAEHFLKNTYNYPVVNHIDLNKSNNHISNLEWTTEHYNEVHSRVYGKNKNKRYKPFSIVMKDGTVRIYDFTTELANELGVTKSTVKFWLHQKNKGYKKYNIKKIRYITKIIIKA